MSDVPSVAATVAGTNVLAGRHCLMWRDPHLLHRIIEHSPDRVLPCMREDQGSFL
jgi:hypothetical protein